jgi:hypothetical protein
MSEAPVIDNEDIARKSKIFIDRGKLCLKDLEDEREQKVRPLNQQVQEINSHYRQPRTLLQKVLDELQSRLSVFLRAEEQRRIKTAEEARQKVADAELAAREAERIEQDRIAEAAAGVLGADVGQAITEADKVFATYQKATREAARAERNINPRIGGGFMRAIGLKDKESLFVTDAISAVKDIGSDNPTLNEALVKCARAYRRLYNRLPDGIESTVERKA